MKKSAFRRRVGLKPAKGLKPGKPLKRGGKLRARKLDPAKRRFSGLRDAEYAAWIRLLPCCITGTVYQVQAAHVRSRGAGGSDVGNLVPLTASLHREQHDIGIQSFQAKHGVDLNVIARALWVAYEKERGIRL